MNAARNHLAGSPPYRRWSLAILALAVILPGQAADEWRTDSEREWTKAIAAAETIELADGFATPTDHEGVLRSVVHKVRRKQRADELVITQSPTWQNWEPVDDIGPKGMQDAPVCLALGPKNYWMFGRYPKGRKSRGGKGKKAATGGYHAWQSRDMVKWVHHGPVTEQFSRWVTTAEHVDGTTYFYYDYPNDQDPHCYVDADLTDGKPGKNLGMVFKDPTHGSDCAIIRDLDGRFHLFYEDWSPIDAKSHSWDSPLAGHAVSPNGIGDFRIMKPAVDQRTKPTGKQGTYKHPHWRQHPNWTTNVGEYEIHEPEQNAFGDWAAISIGGQYYLFGDYHPAHKPIRVAWFTSSDPDEPFAFCGEIGDGHPDPDVLFAEGKFYLVTQMATDYVSPGPWVERVEARAGVDQDGDGTIDRWTAWQDVNETYDYTEGFAKQIARTPAALDLRRLPAGLGFAYEIRITDTTENASLPVLDSVTMTFR